MDEFYDKLKAKGMDDEDLGDAKKVICTQKIKFCHLQKWRKMEKKEVDDLFKELNFVAGIRMTILSVLGH